MRSLTTSETWREGERKGERKGEACCDCGECDCDVVVGLLVVMVVFAVRFAIRNSQFGAGIGIDVTGMVTSYRIVSYRIVLFQLFLC